MPNSQDNRKHTVAALAVDAACVITFTAVGRLNHGEGLTVGGIAETAWPFLVGAGAGWVLSRGWRRPTAVAPTGVTVWVCTVALAMLLRRLTSEGTALSFVVVATLVTGFLLIGWRAAAAIGRRVSRPV